MYLPDIYSKTKCAGLDGVTKLHSYLREVSPSHFPPTLNLDLIGNSLRPFLACLEISPRYTKNVKNNHLNLSRHQVDRKRPCHPNKGGELCDRETSANKFVLGNLCGVGPDTHCVILHVVMRECGVPLLEQCAYVAGRPVL